MCTHGHACIFGKIENDEMHLNSFGKLVESEWTRTPHIRKSVLLDTFIVMPNHIHGIIVISEPVGATGPVAPTTSRLQPNSLGSIIGQFKSVVTKKIRKMGLTDFQWQRNYYEHIIRNEDELYKARKYSTLNPLKWALDKENHENWNCRT